MMRSIFNRDERNPLLVGGIGLALLLVAAFIAFNLQLLPFVGGGDTYRAAFSEAGGLRPGNEVRVAGVKVGTVKSVELADRHVVVEFRVTEPVRLGSETRAVVRIKTLLAAKYLALLPSGPGELDPDKEIPLSRTVSAYDVVEAFSDLTRTTERIDTERLATALDTLATTFEDSPEHIRRAVDGLSRLSRTIASRDEELHTLLDHANSVSGVLAARSDQLTVLMGDANLFFERIQARRDVIHRLLVNTSRLAVQLSGLVEDNREQIKPALDRLHEVLRILKENQADLERTIHNLQPFARLFTNIVGNGPWFDGMVQNLVPAPSTVQPAPTRELLTGGVR